MTTAIRRRRGTTTQHSTFTGLDGEVTVDTTKKTLVVHDGSTAGGIPLAKENNATLTGSVTLPGTSVFNSTGLGIGTSSPANKLVVSNAGANGFEVDPANSLMQTYNRSGGAYTAMNLLALSMAFKTGASPATTMLLDSSGNLGLGVTPSAWGSSVASQVGYGAALSSRAAGNTASDMTHGAYWNGTNWLYQYSSVGAARYQMTGANAGSTHAWFVSAGGTAGNTITFTQAMTLNASGQLETGIAGSASAPSFTRTGDLNTGIFFPAADTIAFAEGGVESARITSAGAFIVGDTALVASGFAGVKFDGASYNGLGLNDSAAANTAGYIYFQSAGTTIGSIARVGATSAVAYNSTSDQRLKENIQDAAPASALIDAIKVRQYDWKSDGSHQRYGFVAQELVSVAPEAVHAPADPEAMMAVDYSKLVPMLVKEIQSLRQRVAQLEGA